MMSALSVRLRLALVGLVLFGFAGAFALAGDSMHPADSTDALAAGFGDPPQAARPLTWWHWCNGYVTREGITADLAAMKRAGLAGAQLFTVRQTLRAPDGSELQGPLQYNSPQWRALLEHTLRECARLGLELSLMHTEGWGQAGGAWVTPDEAMQKVVWTETRLTGGRRIALPHEPRQGQFGPVRDIALLAFPTGAGDEPAAPPRITSSRGEALTSGSVLTLPLPQPDAPQWVRVDFDTTHTFRSLRIDIRNMRDTGDPEAWEDSAFLDAPTQELLRRLPGPHRWQLEISRDGGATFAPLGPIATHGTSVLPPTRGRNFRLWMPVPPPLASDLPLARSEKIEITAITFGGARLDRPEARAGQSINAAANEFSNLPAYADAGAIDPARMIDLTGRREWDVPPGEWTLLRLGHTATGAHIAAGAHGSIECDKLSRAAVEGIFTRGMLADVLPLARPWLGTTLTSLLCDSWEGGNQTWTPRMREEFLRRRGYALDPWLPALCGHVVAGPEASERFLWDFRRTIADLVADNYYGVLHELSARHGLGVYAEATGHGLPAVVDQLQCKGRTTVPMGEFWVGRRDVADTREAASAAHIYGLPIVAAESYTATPDRAAWTRTPASLKAEGDLQFCNGVNRFAFHRFAHQPWLDRVPGMTMGWWGTNFDRTNTWWEPGRAWIAYIARCQFLLQAGTFVADACYYYGADTPRDVEFARLRPALPPGYDFDVCNTEILSQFRVEDGQLVLPSGMRYRVLILPDQARMPLAVLRVVHGLVRAGATVVGPRPQHSPSLADAGDPERELARLAAKVWGDCNGNTVTTHAFGKGRVYWGAPLNELLGTTLGVAPDFTSSNPDLKYIHRRTADAEIYFISNQRAQAVAPVVGFRVDGRQPELWDPEQGTRTTPALFATHDGRTSLPLRLDSEGSVFVVFRKPAPADRLVALEHNGRRLSESDLTSTATLAAWPDFTSAGLQLAVAVPGEYAVQWPAGRRRAVQVAALPTTLPITGPWQLRFPSGRGAPSQATFAQLASWTASAVEGIRYFSGTATYAREFDLPAGWLRAGQTVWLSLGRVKELAEVRLNGHELGTLWKAPFELEMTRALRAGANHLEIRVTNLWPNRLIGDQRLPLNQRITWTSYNPYKSTDPLLESGLLGPVELRARAVVVFAK